MTEKTPAPRFGVADRVVHKAYPEIVGKVLDVARGALPNTFVVDVAWPVGSPVELIANTHAETNLAPAPAAPEEEYPVCPGCGQRHPEPDPEEVRDAMTAVILQEASAIALANPGKYPKLERAFAIGAAATQELMVRELASELDSLPTAEEPEQ
jgi:hypothetical protein